MSNEVLKRSYHFLCKNMPIGTLVKSSDKKRHKWKENDGGSDGPTCIRAWGLVLMHETWVWSYPNNRP